MGAGLIPTYSDQEPFERKLNAPPDTVRAQLRLVAEATQSPGTTTRIYITEGKDDQGVAQIVRVESANGGGAIGKLYLLPLPSDHTLLQIPLGRGSTTPARSYNHDPNGQIFSKYLEAVLQEMARLGFITARGRFSSVSVLESAKQALASARDATGYASVGNSCRLALIGLANEIYDPSMGPADAPELKGDDGKGKLRRAAAHYGATLAERQYDAFARIVESAWDFAAPLPHRKHAERKHAEVCVALVTTIFDCFALMVPDAGSR